MSAVEALFIVGIVVLITISITAFGMVASTRKG